MGTKLSSDERREVVAAMIYASRKGLSWANCWAYALQLLTPSGRGSYKLQPGHLARDERSVDLRSCADLRRKVLEDGRATPKPARGSCPRGTHEIAAYIDPNKDYHWYVRQRDVVVHYKPGQSLAGLAKKFGVPLSNIKALPKLGLALLENANKFTHKPGTTAVKVTDSCGNAIDDPDKACRRSGDLNYTVPCGRFCARDSREPVTIVPADGGSSQAAAEMSALAHKLSASV